MVDSIELSSQFQAEAACDRALHHWMSTATRQPVVWGTLLQALRDADLNTPATNLEERVSLGRGMTRTILPVNVCQFFLNSNLHACPIEITLKLISRSPKPIIILLGIHVPYIKERTVACCNVVKDGV